MTGKTGVQKHHHTNVHDIKVQTNLYGKTKTCNTKYYNVDQMYECFTFFVMQGKVILAITLCKVKKDLCLK